ncbi:carbohydrate-binding domain-containing protein [Candidatus Saccharibacteria bacterium]|nr:carbohydrate-binding domain-containing protein [Candidatus Saccharibacteria bacterium]
MKTNIKKLAIILPLLFGTLLAPLMSLSAKATSCDYSLNLSDSTYTTSSNSVAAAITQYEDYTTFLNAYSGNTLPAVYLTNFLYDGVGRYTAYDLDDAIAAGNDDYSPTPLTIQVLNINTTGNICLTGEFTGMLALNTNDLSADVNLALNGVNINTDNKKVPAIYIYNRDITYSAHQVFITTAANTTNTIEGGKFKKVSLMDKDNLSGGYATYSSYYGVYTAAEVAQILFAKVAASQEDLADGDPTYFYKGAGAISSDIDLTFTGEGSLTVTSKNKEGIETKGNLTFSGGTGDYTVYAQDDALNTTTANSVAGAHNTLTIDVKSLKAVVVAAADEGDAIDSNGQLIINGGAIEALAHPTTPDAGLDAETGILINGGTVISLGNMSDQISQNSTQPSIMANLTGSSGTTVTIKDANNNAIVEYTPDRNYTVFVYSSPSLVSGNTYSIYLNDTLAATVTATSGQGGGVQPGPAPDDGARPTPPDGDNTPPTPPSDNNPPATDGSTNDQSSDGTTVDTVDQEVVYTVDTDEVSVPSTSAYTASTSTTATIVTAPNTGRNSAGLTTSKTAPAFAWAVSGLSATSLVAYTLINRKKHAVRFRR